MKVSVVLFIVLLVAASNAFGQEKNEPSKSDMKIVEEIRTVLETQVAAWNRGDIDGFMQGYWNSEKMVFVSGDSVTKGWQPTLERYKKSYNTREKMGTLTFSDLEFNVLSKTNAVVIGRWMVTKDKETAKGRFTLILKKMKEGWRIIHDHTSSG